VRALAFSTIVVASLTEPASIPKEPDAVVPRLAAPVQLIVQKDATMYSMVSDY
jgi:hypothetical protein